MKNTATTKLIAGLTAVVICSNAMATTLVYEGFNGYKNGSIDNQAVVNTTGLTGNYNTYSGGMTVSDSSGLTFSNLQVSGGALTTSSVAANATGIALNFSTSATVYGSYLSSFSDAPSGDSFFYTGINIRTGARFSTRYYNIQADSARSGETTTAVKFGTNPTQTGVNANGTTLATGVTYLTLFEINQSANTIESWTLTESQFDTILSDNAGLISTSALNSGVVTSKASSTSTASDLAHALQILMSPSAGTYTIDEIRYGTSLSDVVKIPEPSTSSMILGACFLLFAVAGRQTRS
jgi:hypothetical protein